MLVGGSFISGVVCGLFAELFIGHRCFHQQSSFTSDATHKEISFAYHQWLPYPSSIPLWLSFEVGEQWSCSSAAAECHILAAQHRGNRACSAVNQLTIPAAPQKSLSVINSPFCCCLGLAVSWKCLFVGRWSRS